MTANKTQVGGDHYKVSLEHWDYVIANGLNYFEGQITKYVTRCRKKDGLKDLEKAKHFLEKYIECYKDIAYPPGSLKRYEDTQPIYVSDDTFLCEGGYGDGNMLYTHRTTKKTLVAKGLDEAHKRYAVMKESQGEPWPPADDSDANNHYVNQG